MQNKSAQPKQRSEGHLGPNTRYTPGPWRVDTYQNESDGVWNVTVNTDYPPGLCNGARSIAVMTGSYYTAPGEFHEPNALPVNQANARLIAAAPSMYEALDATQAALAAWRDNEPIMHNGREIGLEEFKYLVVDPILELADPSRAEGGAA